MARRPASIAEWIGQHLRDDPPRARSLIVTIFGDAVAPWSDGIWLSDLIELLEPFDANERLVRTSVFRLTEEGWLVSRRDGRRSYYTLAPTGRRRFQYAYDRVYKAPPPWDGTWTVVVLPKTDHGAPDRVELRRELEWEGYGALGPGVFVRPAADGAALEGILEELGLAERALVYEAKEVAPGRARADLVAQCWNLFGVAKDYEQFVERYAPPLRLLENGAPLSPAQAFVVQSLLIDTYRRVTLHDPHLPPALLPGNWPGHAAYAICQQLYRRTFGPARQHLAPRFGARAGAALPPELRSRFGGL